MAKTIKMSKRELVEEHKQLLPKLKRAGLRSEYKKQSAELKRLRKR